MKKPLSHWITEHEQLIAYAIGLPACVLISCGLYACRVGFFGVLLVALIILFVPFFAVALLRAHLLNKAVFRQAKECDPEVLLCECRRQLPTVKPGEYKNLLLLNYYTAQHMLGEHQKALDSLLSLDLGKVKKRPTSVNFAYCNNLSDIYDLLGQTEAANHWYREATEIYRALSKPEQVAYHSTMILLEAQNCIRNRTDLDRALQSINALPESQGAQGIGRAITRAQIYLLQNRIEEARADLDFVIAHGNKLGYVALARELYKKGIEQS